MFFCKTLVTLTLPSLCTQVFMYRLVNLLAIQSNFYLQNGDVIQTGFSLFSYLSVEHDNFGFSAGWFLDKVLLDSYTLTLF